MPAFNLRDARIAIRCPAAEDCDELLSLVHSSRNLHHPWVEPPSTREQFETYLQSRQCTVSDGFVLCNKTTNAILGVVNLNIIVRGKFDSAYLGYYIGAANAGQGFMTEGLKLVARYAFKQMGLHRLEANIQPGNLASIAVARKCGFQLEGFSPKYLKILGQWRDHERWALLADAD